MSERRSINQPKPPVKKSIKASYKRAKKNVKISFYDVKEDYRWEQLQEIEDLRRDVLLRVEDPYWRTILRYNGTVLQLLWSDILFWTTIILYIFFRLLAHYGLLSEDLNNLDTGSLSVLGAFVSFFLVFWVNQSHARYFGLYEKSMGCKGRIFDAASMAVTSLPYAQAARLIRYMNAAHAAAYVGLSEVYPSGSYFNHVNKVMGLLTKEERARLDDIDLDKGGACNREILVWCMAEVNASQKKGFIDEHLACRFRDEILGLRGCIGALYNAKDLPIPFFYVHFICLITTVYLPLFAVTNSILAGIGEESSAVTAVIRGITVILVDTLVIGLRVLGQKLNDPYGDDLVDLSVMYFVSHTWKQSNRILNSHFPEEANAAVEDALQVQSDPLGGAWDHKIKTPEQPQSLLEPNSTVSLGQTGQTEETSSEDVETKLNERESRVILNPEAASTTSLATTPTSGGGDVNDVFYESMPYYVTEDADRSRVIFNPALRESDLNMVSYD